MNLMGRGRINQMEAILSIKYRLHKRQNLSKHNTTQQYDMICVKSQLKTFI